MTAVIWYVCGIAAGYLLGCINTAAILARIKGFDIRSHGSGNAGASNALVTMGKGAAAASALFDMAKAFVPVFLLCRVITPPEGCGDLFIAVGAAVILGNMFPFWMQFQGGKGFASLLGLSLALDWRFFVAGILLTAVILLTLRFIAIATVLCTIALPAAWYFSSHSLVQLMILLVPAVCMFVKHIENFTRIQEGTEIPFGKKISQNNDKNDAA